MAEFLHILAEQYDYPQLADEILRELSNKEFNSNDTKGPKSVSTFMVKLSELAPRVVIKQVTLLAKQLDSEVFVLDACRRLTSLTRSVACPSISPYRGLWKHARLPQQVG